jgi:TetR/AcrR family transcriptional regulator, transcriptional repressor for nem operon
MIKAIARHLDDGDPQRRTERAIGLLGLLVGSLQLARAVIDPALSDQVLSAAHTNAMRLAGAQPGAHPFRPSNPTQESP